MESAYRAGYCGLAIGDGVSGNPAGANRAESVRPSDPEWWLRYHVVRLAITGGAAGVAIVALAVKVMGANG